MPYRIVLFLILLTAIAAPCRMVIAQTDSTKTSVAQAAQVLTPISSNCLMAGHTRLDFSDATPNMSGPSVTYQRFPFRRPVYFSLSLGTHWAEAKEDTVDLKVVEPEISMGVACNFLAIPSLERLISSVIPMDLLLSLGGRVAADYAPYYLNRHYHSGYGRGDLKSTKMDSRWNLDTVGWSYSFFEAFLLDKSIGQKIETGVSSPVAGENRVSRTYVRFGLVFNL